MASTSHYEDVKIFTAASALEPLPKQPRSMTLEKAKFLFTMKFSEAAEFFTSFDLTKDQIRDILHECVEGGMKDLQPWTLCTSEVERIVRQTDALIDDEYYTYNGAAQCDLPIDECFSEVHRANMDKRFPDGTFHRREDGKIIKPPGWRERDLSKIVSRKLA